MIELFLDLCLGLIVLAGGLFAAESTRMVEEKKKRQRERKNKQFYETYYTNTRVGFFYGCCRC